MTKRTDTSPSFPNSMPRGFRFIAVAILLGMVCFLVYNANLRQIGSGDTLPARYLPLILWQEGTLSLDANQRMVAHGHSMIASWNRPAGADGKVTYFEPWAYWIARTRQHQAASLYPVVTPLLVFPLYLPAFAWLNTHGWEQPQIDRAAEVMEKVSASLLAAITCMLMYLVLRYEGNRWSLPLALAFAFGTNTWMISSQALWQPSGGEFLIALALVLLVIPSTPIRATLLGAVCVLMAANRPPDALIAGAMLLYMAWSHKRSIVWLLAGAAIPLTALLVYNLYFIGEIAGGYALVRPTPNFFQPVWSGLAGLLVSPTRGLLIFTPFLIFVPVGLYQRLRTPGTKWLVLALSFAAAAQILLYARGDWRGGTSWGPRWLTDLLPLLVWILAPAPLVLRPLMRGLLTVLILASVGVQTIGAFWYTKTSDDLIFAGDLASMNGAWNLKNIPYLTELRHAPAPGELLCDGQSSIDRIGEDKLPMSGGLPVLETGSILEGWALTCGRTPAQVVMVIDGIVVGSTTVFLVRTDVNKAMHTASPSGWRISANTLGIPPGERVLQMAVRIAPRSDIRIIREQRVLVRVQEPAAEVNSPVPAPELARMAERAAVAVREHQTKDGYWLTTFTSGLSYDAPGQEMNTFTTAMLVDMLAPNAQRHGLGDVVERARTHLAGRIESSGLVRYHGLPDSPIIGTLGCAITPDSDDTALAWRIARPGPDDSRKQAMLDELARYRDARGLYHTWLAPKKQYQGIDPGEDPNPTDIVIQMHVYMMLRELYPPAAQDLCTAIQRSFGEAYTWVYYAKTPLIPYLRSAELRQLGCEVPLPVERLKLPAAGQEIWSEAARLLVKISILPQDEAAVQAIRGLLSRMGSDDFTLLRRNPPMLYHNDLSATVRRFYWSEDFGYALWLRLYDAVGMETRASPQTNK